MIYVTLKREKKIVAEKNDMYFLKSKLILKTLILRISKMGFYS